MLNACINYIYTRIVMSRNKKLKYAYIYFIFNTPKIEFIIIVSKMKGPIKI